MAYKDYNKQMNVYMKKRYHTRRAEAIKRLGGCCAKCATIKDLQIDHIDRATKAIALNKLWSCSKEIFDTELQKCQVLCKACHLEKSRPELSASTKKAWEEGKYKNRNVGG